MLMDEFSLPLTVPEKPAFGRETFKHSIKTLAEDISYDDCYSLNTQSGTQWDGFRHVSLPMAIAVHSPVIADSAV